MKILLLLLTLLISLPGFGQEDADAELEKIEANRKRQQELVEKLTGGVKKKEAPKEVPEELKKLGYSSLNAKSIMDERVVRVYQNLLRKNPLQKSPRKNVEQIILEQTRDSLWNPFLKGNPAILACVADIVKDKNAMADALGIFLRKGDLKLYAIIWVLFMIMGWLIKKIVLNEDWPRWQYHVMSFIISVGISVVSLSVFYKIFENELSTTVQIILRHF